MRMISLVVICWTITSKTCIDRTEMKGQITLWGLYTALLLVCILMVSIHHQSKGTDVKMTSAFAIITSSQTYRGFQRIISGQ